jgi:NodT family efflux transporter outer membrane factor (OMF) lipoprotein
MVGPNYKRPPVETPPAFKEVAGWQPAQPQDSVDRGAWWSVFNDPTLNDLESKVAISNQTLKADEAAYVQARALVAEDRATLFPTVNLTGGETESGGGGSGLSNLASAGHSTKPVTVYQTALGASWAPDLWGKIRRTIEGAKASAQASAADIANAKLTFQSEVAADYFQLRLADADAELLTDSVKAYERSLQITQNKYKSGVSAQADVLSAESLVESTQASLINLGIARTQAEHAIAVLIGVPPSELTIAKIPGWKPQVPTTPKSVPSEVLQRRPDIAAAERSAASASAGIGVQVAGFFPDITLNASYGFESTAMNTLFKTTSSAWSGGGNFSQVIFDAGATGARVKGAKAAYAQSVATYRQTVLTAFQNVEDELSADRVLQNEEPWSARASASADKAEQITVNEYKAGTVDYTTVVTAEVTALNARQTLLTLQVQRMSTQVSLIEALGGGWTLKDLPKD